MTKQIAPVATIERALTTPSNLIRRLLCPGSAKREAGLSDTDSAWAASGRLFHRYWTNKNYERRLLTPDEQELLEIADRLFEDVLSVLQFDAAIAPHIEQTITGLNGRLTGTPDRVDFERSDALVTDLKSGFFAVERAELNLQLRGYAVLVDENHKDHRRIYVAILQPRLWNPSERVTLAQYDQKDIKQARTQIDRIIDATEQPDAPLVAGEDQCRFCRAKLFCPAFRKALNMPLAKFETEEELSKLKREEEIKKRVTLCSDEQLEQVLRAVQIASVVDDSVRAECRARIRAGKFTRFVLGKDSEASSINDVRKAISMLALSNIGTREEITALCTLSMKALTDHYRTRKGGTWKAARDKIDRVLKAVITKTPRDPKILPKEKK